MANISGTYNQKGLYHNHPGSKWGWDGQSREPDRRHDYNEPANSEEIDFKSLFILLWRRKWMILFLLFLGIVGALYISSQIERVYTSRSYILLETNKKIPSELSGLIEKFELKDSIILNETQILKSRNFALRVIKALDLKNDPEFKSGLKQTKQNLGAGSKSGNGFRNLDLTRESFKDSQDLEAFLLNNPGMTNVINRLQKAVRINSVPGTNVIFIEVSSHSPFKAARIANAYARLYIKQRRDNRFEETRRLTSWLNKRLEELKEQVRQAQREVARYQVEHNLIHTYKGELTSDQLTHLNNEMVRARAELAVKKARTKQIGSNINSAQALLSSPDVMKSVTIRELKKQHVQLLQERSELKSRYGPKHPKIKSINEELEVLREETLSEARNIIEANKKEVLIARARLDALEHGFNNLLQMRAQDSEAMIRLQELMLEAETSRATYDKFLSTYKRVTQQEGLQGPEARIISYATVPATHVYPDKKMFIALAAILMLFFGIALTLFLEKFNTAFSSVSQLEKLTRLPCFGVIPELRARRRDKILQTIWRNTSSSKSENVRNLRAILKLRGGKDQHKEPKVVTMTSSLPGEGKSTLSTWLAILAAKSGEKVCLIDCDLRSPVLHKHIPSDRENTLVEFLTGQAEIEQVIKKDEKSGLFVIFAKSVPSRALDLISSEKMEELIESLRQEFDLVILDSPSCLLATDPKMLSRYSDYILYAVAWNKTDRDQVKMGLKQFDDIGYNDIATVLSRVDLRSFARHGYGEAGYYASY